MKKNNSYKNAIVAIKKYNYNNLDIESLLNPLGGIDRYIKKGDRVLLKTNLLNASEPERSVVTHPDFIRSIIKEIFKIDAIPYIGDSPS